MGEPKKKKKRKERKKDGRKEGKTKRWQSVRRQFEKSWIWRGEVGRETRVRGRRKSRRRRKKRTDFFEGEGERKDPKSGQDSQVSAIGKGKEAKEHSPNGGFVQSKIKMWIAVSSSTQRHTGLTWRGVQDNPES